MKLRTLSGVAPNPAPGQGLVYQFSPIERVKLVSLQFRFQASAAVANRNIYVGITDPNGIIVFSNGNGTAITAGQAFDHVVSPIYNSAQYIFDANGTAFGMGIPSFWMPPAWSITASAGGIQAGDQFSAITYAAHYSEDIWHKEQDQAAWAAAIAALAL